MWKILFTAAIGVFLSSQPALAADPDPAACVWKGMRQRQAEVIDACTAVLSQLVISKEARFEALFTRGRAYHNLLRLEPAMQDYMEAASIEPTNVDLLVSRANIFSRMGRWELQRADLSRAQDINPNHVDLLISLGGIALTQRETVMAIKYLSRAIELDPKATFAYIRRKDAFIEMNNLESALADAEAAVRVSEEPDQPNYFENGRPRDIRVAVLIERGELLEKMGKSQRSAQDYDAAVAKDKSAFALIRRVQDMKRGTTADIVDLKEAIRREPDNARAIYTLGLRLMGEREFGGALIAFNQALEVDPEHAYSLWMRARIHRESGNTEEAMRDFMQAISLNPKIMTQTIPALRMAGYWRSFEVPTSMTPALMDALRACMIDVRCN